jgi:putative IMPACT (imprinted ancient) family translation regulator
VAELERRFDDASHVCFAWRVGWPPAERAADAGEPPGTAGAPLLAALRGARLTDVVVAVVRYFGGTKLGRGGLARAYAGAAAEALARLPTKGESESARLVVRTSHERQGAVRRLLRAGRIELESERYDAGVELVLRVAKRELHALERSLADLGIASDADRR